MRSMCRALVIAVAGASVVGLLSGCAKAPEQELAAATTALQAAQAAEADKYQADGYANAMKALTAAQSEITKQNASFFAARNYAEATRILGIATKLATELQANAAAAKEATKVEVEAALVAAQASVKEARVDVRKAPRSKGKDVLAGMAADLTVADSALVQAAAEIAASNYLGAQDKISDANAKMKKVSDQLSTSLM